MVKWLRLHLHSSNVAAVVSMTGEQATDPEAQATVTDFLDYTEYLPADLTRSLTLLEGLDKCFWQNAHQVHRETQQYGALPNIPVSSRPDPGALRTSISTHLDRAMGAREASYAEAGRLFDIADRHYNRLNSIVKKLHTLPRPALEDSAQGDGQVVSRETQGNRDINDGTSKQRLTLNPPRAPSVAAHLAPKIRNQYMAYLAQSGTTPNPDSPIVSTEQADWNPDTETPFATVSERKSPISPNDRMPKTSRASGFPLEHAAPYKMPTPPPEDSRLGSEHRPWTRLTEWEMWKLRKKMKKNIIWEPSEVMIQRELAEKGRGWDNYHKARVEALSRGETFLDVDGLDEVLGGDVPSGPKEGTTGELLALRNKGMKLNEAKRLKRETVAQEQTAGSIPEAGAIGRKKGSIGSALKNLFSPLGTAFADLSSSISSSTANEARSIGKKNATKRKIGQVEPPSPAVADAPSTQKRQKVETKPIASFGARDTKTTRVPLKITLPGAAPDTVGNQSAIISSASGLGTPACRANSTRRASAIAKNEATSATLSQPPSRRRSGRASFSTNIDMLESPVNQSLSRRTSTAGQKSTLGPLEAGMTRSSAKARSQRPHDDTIPLSSNGINSASHHATAASSRPKRRAPGTITQSSADGGVAVSMSSRRRAKSGVKPRQFSSSSAAHGVNNNAAGTSHSDKAASTKTTSRTDLPPPQQQSHPSKPQVRIDIDGNSELIDPDEERFCICNDVSWGEMICCEMDDRCEDGQWFHLSCVGLVELPARTVKWYSPACRRKWKKGLETGGCVGRGVK